jgi:hypothetical protein
MAEWIGHFIRGWPTWMIGVFAILFLIGSAYISWLLDFWIWKSHKTEGKKLHAKK